MKEFKALNRFQMTASALAITSLMVGTVLSFSDTANAQRIVTCQSENNHYITCPMVTRYGVRLVKKLSDASCRGNWGYKQGYVWVKNGCRAEFIRG